MGITASSVVLRVCVIVWVCCVSVSHLHAGEPELEIVPARIQLEPGHLQLFQARARGPGGGFLQNLRWSATGGQIAGQQLNAQYTAGQQQGIYQILVQKGNGKGAPQGTAQVKIGYAPTAQALAITTRAGVPVACVLVGADRDRDALTYRVVRAPAHGALTGTAPHLLYTPQAGFVGTDTVLYEVTDGWSTSAQALVTITVQSALEITSPLNAQATVGIPMTYTVTASEPAATFALDPVPAGLTWSPSTGVLAGMPTQAGVVTLQFTATAPGGQATAQVRLDVSRGTPTLTWPAPAPLVAGVALGASQLNAQASVPGVMAYTPPAGTVLAVGQQSLTVAFTPNDVANWNPVSGQVSITVLPGAPVVTWAAPPALVAGEALSEIHLNAIAAIAGTFSYHPPAGTRLPIGTHTLSAVFTPFDQAQYALGAATTTVTVLPAPPRFIQAPTADAAVIATTSTTLRATAVAGDGGPISSYTWRRLDGPDAPVAFTRSGTADAGTTGVRFTRAGTYTLLCQVRDATGAQAESSVEVVVQAVAAAAVIGAGAP